MKRNKLITIILVTIVACLLLAAAMATTACKGSGGEEEEPSGGGGTSFTLPSGVVYRVSANTAKKDLRFSWENVTYPDLRLYNVKQDDEILIPKGMTYVDLSFRGTTEYNFEYYEDGAWKVLQPIVFYKKADLNSSAIVASYTSNDRVTISWQQTDFAENPLYEVLIRQGSDESLEQVTGSSITRALADDVEYTMSFREVDSIYVDSETEKLVVPYSYWSDPIDVCKLSSVGQIEYDDKAEKIMISKVQNAFGYRVSVYYPEQTEPVKRFVPSQEAMGHDNVLLSFAGIADMTGSFTLYVEPIGTDNVVNSDGKLYIAPKDPTRQDVVMVTGVQDLELDGDTLSWKNQMGCSYYLHGTVKRSNSITTTFSDIVNPVSGETVHYKPADLPNGAVTEIEVKPIYLQKNTFSRWASISGLYVLKAPEEVTIGGNNGGVELTWRRVDGLSYTVRRTQDTVALPDVAVGAVGSFVLVASDIGPGDYTFSVGAMNLSKSYRVKDFSLERMEFVEHEETGCFGYVSPIKTAMKFEKPSYKVSHIAPSGEYGSRDSIRIEITSRDTTLSYKCVQDGSPLSIDKETYSFVINNDESTDTRSRSVELYVVGSSDITKKRDVAIQSDPESFSVLKPSDVPQDVIVTSNSVTWTPSAYSYVVKMEEGSSMTPTKYAVDYQTEAFFDFSRLFELAPAFAVGDTRKTLAAGGYRVSVCYSRGYSNVSGSETQSQSSSTTEYWLDGNYATVKFYKNSVPTGQYLDKRLSVFPADGETGAFGFKINGVDFQTASNATGINITQGILDPGENVISVVLKGSLIGDNKYNLYLDSDPFLFSAKKLTAPVPQIKNSRMTLIDDVKGATGYAWDVDTLSSNIVDEVDVDLRTILKAAKTYTLYVSALYIGTEPIFDSDAAEITVTKLEKPSLFYQDQAIRLTYPDGIEPASLSFRFYKNLDPTTDQCDYSISTRNSLDLRLSALKELLSLNDDRMVPGWYSASFISIGNGVTTLDSDRSDDIEFYKQYAPDLVFRKGDGYHVDLTFKGIYTSSYSFRQDSDPDDPTGSTVGGTSSYNIVYKEMVEGTHSYTAFLNNDNKAKYLPSDEAVITYYKLYRPTDFVMAKDFSSISWRVADNSHAAYYTVYHYENVYTDSQMAGETEASVSSALFNALSSGDSGELTVFSVGSDSEEKRTLDSEPAVCTYTRAVTPTISFVNNKSAATDDSKITWNYPSDAVYSFAFNNDVMTSAINGREATFPSALSAGTHELKLRECGDPVAFRLPSDYSASVSVKKLKTVGEIVKGNTLSWGEVSDATKYIVTSDNEHKKTVVDREYDWKTELLDAGEYALRVIARSDSNSENIIDGNPSEVVIAVKLAVPNVNLARELTWTAVAEAETYDVTVVGGGTTEKDTPFVDLSPLLVEAGDYTVKIQAKATSGSKYYLTSEPMIVSVTRLAAPTASVNIENGRIVWGALTGASSYTIKVSNDHWETVKDTTEYDISSLVQTVGTYKAHVRANGGVSDNRIYLNSVNSSELTAIRLGAPSVSLSSSTGTVGWSTVTNASKYTVSVTGANVSFSDDNVNATSYNVAPQTAVAGIYSVKVTALGGASIDTIVLDSTPRELTVARLDTPELSLSNRVLGWASLEHAKSYKVNGESVALVREIDLSSYAAGNYDFSVQAIGGTEGGIGYLDSAVAETTVHVVKLATPSSGLGLNGKTLVWDVVAHASGYTYSVNEGEAIFSNTVDLAGYTAGDYAFSVRAIGASDEDTVYVDSDVAAITVHVVKLAAPVLGQSNKKVTWPAVSNAFSYVSWADNDEPYTLTEYDASTLSEGEHTIRVKAVGGVSGDTVYLDSDVSAFALSAVTLDSPVLTQNSSTIEWEDVAKASGYQVSLNGGNWAAAENYDISSLAEEGIYTISVRALGSVETGTIYLDSLAATYTITVVRLEAPSLTLNGTTVEWDEDENASGYRVSVDDGNTWTPATDSYDASALTENATVSVQALGKVTAHYVYLDSVLAAIDYIVEELN